MARVSTYALMNGVNRGVNKNFISTIYSIVLAGDTTIRINGNYPYLAENVYNDEYLIIENEIIKIVSSTYNVDHTDFIVRRGSLNTTASNHSTGVTAHSAQILNLKSLNYKKYTEFSSSDLFGVNVSDGSLKLNDTGLLWSPQSSDRKYDYGIYKSIFIFEESNGVSNLEFLGVSNKLIRDSRNKQTSIQFYNKFITKFKKSPDVVRYYINKTIKEVLEDLFSGYTVEYKDGLVEADFRNIDLLNTSNFSTNGDIINFISKNTATRIFIDNNSFKIINDLDPSKLEGRYENELELVDIYKGVLDIDGNEDSYIKINKINAEYTEKKAYRNANDFTIDNKIQYFGSTLETKVYTLSPIDLIINNEYQVVTLEGLHAQFVTYGDSIVIIDSDTNLEHIGSVIDIIGSQVQIQMGRDKYFAWADRGWKNFRTGGTGDLTITNYSVIYPIQEMPIVWKYTRSIENADKTGNLKHPLLPAIKSFNNVASGNIDTYTITISAGDFNTYFTSDDYMFIESSVAGAYDKYTINTIDSTTQITVIEKLKETYVSKSIYSEDGIEEIYTNFNFSDETYGEFSKTVDNIDGIWDTKFDNTSLLCANEFGQNNLEVPLYLYTTKLSKNTSGDFEQTYYTDFDNSDIELEINKSEDSKYDFKAKIKNTLEITEGQLLLATPLKVSGTVIYYNTNDYNTSNCGDVLKLNKVMVGDVRYAIYSTNKDFTWSIQTKETQITTLEEDGVSGTSGADAILTKVGANFSSLYIGQKLSIDDGAEYVIVKSITDDDNVVVVNLVSTISNSKISTIDYIVYVDSRYPKAINTYPYIAIKYPYTSVIHLNEFFIRGNPIMQRSSPQTVDNVESQDIYGELSYELDATSLNENSFKIVLDHLKNSYASTQVNNTRSRFTFKYTDINLNVFDVVNITETLYNGYNSQKALILSKSVTSNDSAHRELEYSAITLGTHTASAKNIKLKTSLNSKPLNKPSYTHRSNEGTEEQDQLIDTKIVSLTDKLTGNSYGLVELSNSDFSATVKSGIIPQTINTSSIELYNIIDTNTRFNSIFKNNKEGFFKINSEYVNFKVIRNEEVTDLTGSIIVNTPTLSLSSGTDVLTIGETLKLEDTSTNTVLYETIDNVSGTIITLKNTIDETFDVKKISVVSVSLEIIRRGVFDTQKTNIGTGDILSFYSILRAETKEGLTSSLVDIGETTIIDHNGLNFKGKVFNNTAYVSNAKEFIGALQTYNSKIKINGSGNILEYSGSIDVSGQMVTTSDSSKSFLDIFEIGDLITLDNGINSEIARIVAIGSDISMTISDTTTYTYTSSDLYSEITSDNVFYNSDINTIQLQGGVKLSDISNYHMQGNTLTVDLTISEIIGSYNNITYSVDLYNYNLSVAKAALKDGNYTNVGMLSGGTLPFSNKIRTYFDNVDIGCINSPNCKIVFRNSIIRPISTSPLVYREIKGSEFYDCTISNLTLNECVVNRSDISVTDGNMAHVFDNCTNVTNNVISATATTNLFGGTSSKFVQFNTVSGYQALGIIPEYEINNSWQTSYDDKIANLELEILNTSTNTAIVTSGIEFAGAILTSLENIPDNSSIDIPNKYYNKIITDIYLANNIDLTGVEEGLLNSVLGSQLDIRDINISSLKNVGVRYILDCKTPSNNCYLNAIGVIFNDVSLITYNGITGNNSTTIKNSDIKLNISNGYSKFNSLKMTDCNIDSYDIGVTPYSYDLFDNDCRIKHVEFKDNGTVAHTQLTFFRDTISVLDFKQTLNNVNLVSTLVFNGTQCDLAEGVILLGSYNVSNTPYRQSDNSWNVNEVLFSGSSKTADLSKPWLGYKYIYIEVVADYRSFSTIIPIEDINIGKKIYIGNSFSKPLAVKITTVSQIIEDENFDNCTIVRVDGLESLGGNILPSFNPNYFDKSADTLDAINNGVTSRFMDRIIATFDTGTTTVASFDTVDNIGAKYTYTISDGTNMRIGDLLIISNGTLSSVSDISASDIGNTAGVTFDAAVTLGIVTLEVTSGSDGWTIKIMKFEV